MTASATNHSGTPPSPQLSYQTSRSDLDDEKNLGLTTTPTDSEATCMPSEQAVFLSSSQSTLVLTVRWYEPPDSYESKHRWDPRATWTLEEESKLVRRLDVRVALFACICFAALQLDRGNIQNALSDNFLGDTHLTTGDYNIGMTIFYVCFLGAELPSQMSELATSPSYTGGLVTDSSQFRKSSAPMCGSQSR